MDLATTYFTPTVAILLISIAVVYASAKKWVNAAFFIGSGLFLVAGEFVSIALTGKTISANHWSLDTAHPEVGALLNILLGALFLVIVVHLAKLTIKRLTDKK